MFINHVYRMLKECIEDFPKNKAKIKTTEDMEKGIIKTFSDDIFTDREGQIEYL